MEKQKPPNKLFGFIFGLQLTAVKSKTHTVSYAQILLVLSKAEKNFKKQKNKKMGKRKHKTNPQKKKKKPKKKKKKLRDHPPTKQTNG